MAVARAWRWRRKKRGRTPSRLGPGRGRRIHPTGSVRVCSRSIHRYKKTGRAYAVWLVLYVYVWAAVYYEDDPFARAAEVFAEGKGRHIPTFTY